MSKNMMVIKWLLRPLILISLKWINVKAGIVLQKGGKSGGKPIEKGAAKAQPAINRTC